MSRLLIKNLPKHLTEERFRQHFQSIGEEVTDAKIIKTSWGVSRRFGFIGFHSDKAASKAINHFNDTYMDTSKISVELALPVGDKDTPRAWSKYTKRKQEQLAKTAPSSTTSAKIGPHVFKVIHADDAPDEVDRLKLDEFVTVMGSKSNVQSWANNDISAEKTVKPSKVTATATLESIPNKKPGGQGKTVVRTHLTFDEEEEEEKAVEQEPSQALHDVRVSDLEYLKSKVRMETEEQTQQNEPKEQQQDEQEEEEEDPAEKQILETGRLFLRNLPFTTSEEDLKKMYAQYGPLADVHVPLSKDTKSPIGIALVTFILPEHALKAFKATDKLVFQGRLLHVLPGQDKLGKSLEEKLEEATTFKQKKAIKRKANATNQFNWNMLYMNADAVTESIAQKLNISKAEILDRDADNLAVRMALAETQTIQDTKDYFRSNGVDVDSLKDTKERSDTVILVKNIPHDTAESELRELFGSFGQLGKVLIPPAKTIAVIEFLEPTEGKTAFRHLAYKRFKDTILFLEKAPAGFFSSTVVTRPTKSTQQDTIQPDDDDEQGDAENCTLYVKNLNFATKEKDLTAIFEAVGALRSVTIRTKPDPKNKDKRISMGFGFVEFKFAKDAKRALAALQSVYLDGHALQLKLSDRASKDAERKTKDKSSTTKLVVRNVPFEATKKDMKELFSNYAQVKSIRLPKKYDGKHRGFAFVEFLTKKEAERAKASLSSTHLYGRHLVLEYADDTQDMEEAREQVRHQLERSENARKKKRRRIQEDEDEEEKKQDMDGLLD